MRGGSQTHARPRSYWDQSAASLLEQAGISMAISCDDEAVFDVRFDEFGVRFHLRMRLSERAMSKVSEYSIFQVESSGHTRPYN
ncbi:hypothetical protein PRIPAC_88421 [Pristionchus pacificus]|uniref:Uncharacterized protein n=1 Tax=Pristionchus pacificus TaxID=54126 RepID=A0A2A6CWR1_PRIPA|nr:hypothetical protein PRIPAC_88421 [Pristionchus pacificus]|eukprot:PDM82461.1 hypothetical protein PRIPAC_36854 [Pristionchus pacificus]